LVAVELRRPSADVGRPIEHGPESAAMWTPGETLGLVFVAMARSFLSGFDKAIETALVNASPQWLTDLTTRF
jgi:hypothetical protein